MENIRITIALIIFLIISMVGNVVLILYTVRNTQSNEMTFPAVAPKAEAANEEDYEIYLRKLFSQEELRLLGKNAWNYVVSVNGQVFNSNTMYVKSDNITIMLAEVRKDHLLPEAIAEMGRLEQESKLIDYIKVFSELSYIIEKESTKQGVKYYLKFSEVPKNTMITIQLSQEIKGRMYYSNNIVEDRLVVVKR